MASPREPEFGPLLARLARALRAHDVPFMLIGGQAVLLHGEPRLTLDVDVTLGVSPEALGTVLAACEAMGVDTLPGSVEEFVRETFVLPVAVVRRRGPDLDWDYLATWVDAFAAVPGREEMVENLERVKLHWRDD